ncbi:MAG: SWIM zinc finger family protein [Synergistaceae bacterium]|jgi:uncharacterized Zn finger protein|nr:SWIM zinc finger family protein [Synergistaceae bacterium]
MGRYDWYDYTPTKPIATRGGIKSKAKGGVNWWSKRWYDFMETFNLGARLARGRSYARKGQVIDVEIEAGLVRGRVQGSRRTPYKVTIRFAPITEEGWERIVSRLNEQLLFAAQLMAGEVPQELEDFFQTERASLFPKLERRSDMQCDCPDSSNPCKHIAALFYVLGDAFDRDPFLLLQLRGMSREKLVALLGMAQGSVSEGEPEERSSFSETEPLPFDDRFYRGSPLFASSLSASPQSASSRPSEEEDVIGPLPRGDLNAPLLRRLGNLPFWRGDEPLFESLQEIYREAADRGRALALGEKLRIEEKSENRAEGVG